MEKDVIISIKGVQRYENAGPDTMELVTEGRLEREGNSYTLSYQESELTGLEGTLTTFQIEPERITLMRVGEFNSQMVFQEGRRHMSMYNTPYGAMTIGVIPAICWLSWTTRAERSRSTMPSKLTTPWRGGIRSRST